MTKIGGVLGAVLAITLVFVVGDRIDWLGNAVAAAFGVGRWVVGSRIARRLTAR